MSEHPLTPPLAAPRVVLAACFARTRLLRAGTPGTDGPLLAGPGVDRRAADAAR